jgi:hypothetical protein
MTKYVRILQETGVHNNYNIKCVSDITQSISKVQPFCAKQVICIWSYECTEHDQFMKWIYKEYATQKGKGDWFNFTGTEIKDVIKNLEENKTRFHDPNFFHTTKTIFYHGLNNLY